MAEHNLGNSHDFPPGTSRLYDGELRHHHEEGLTLVPRPSRDPNQPLNWSKLRKAVNFTFTLALTITVFTALSIQIIFWQLLVIDFKTDFDTLNQTLSTLGAGLALGCIVFVPFALKYGRRPIYIISTGLIFAMMVWSARMESVTELYITNFLTGLGGAVNESLVGMTIADLFFVHQRGTMNGIYLVMVMCGTFLTPIAAGVQSTTQGWRWCYNLLSIFTGLVFLGFVFFYEETKFIPVFDGIQATRSNTDPTEMSKDHQNDHKDATISTQLKPTWSQDPTKEQVVAASTSYHDRIDTSIALKSWKQRLALTTRTPEPLLKVAMRPFLVLWYPHIAFAAIQYAAGLTWLTIIAAVISRVFSMPPYSFSPAGIGYMGLGPFTGNILGNIYSGPINDRAIRWFAKRNNGVFEPEMRLKLLHIPTVFMAGGIIMFGVTTARGMHWIYPSLGGAFFAFALGSFGDASLTMVIDSYRDITGEAFTGIAFLRNAFSIWVPFTISPWMASMGLQNMFILMGCVSLIPSLTFLPLMWFGKGARRRFASRYEHMSALRA